jgi:hypothetical protein
MYDATTGQRRARTEEARRATGRGASDPGRRRRQRQGSKAANAWGERAVGRTCNKPRLSACLRSGSADLPVHQAHRWMWVRVLMTSELQDPNDRR